MIEVFEDATQYDYTFRQPVISSHIDAINKGGSNSRIDYYSKLMSLSITNIESWDRFKNNKLRNISMKFGRKQFNPDKVLVLACDLALYGNSFWVVYDKNMIINKRPWNMYRIDTINGKTLEFQSPMNGEPNYRAVVEDPYRKSWYGVQRYSPDAVVHARYDHQKEFLNPYGRSLVERNGKWLAHYMQMLGNGSFIKCISDAIDEIIEKREKNV